MPQRRAFFHVSAHQRMGLAVWGLVLLFLLALAQGTAWVESTFHTSQRAEKEAQVQHFVAGASAAMNRSLLGWDVLLASAAEQFGRAPAEAGQPLPPDANRWLAQAARHNMQVRYLAIVDAQGQVLASSDPQGEQLLVQLPPEFLQQVLQQPIPSLLFSTAQVSATNFEPSFYVARPVLRGTQARWLAVVQVQAALLTPVLMQSVDIAGLHVSLVRDDGAALLSVPAQSSPGLLPTPLQAGAHWGQELAEEEGTSVGTRSLTLHVAQPTMYPQLWVSARLPASALATHPFDRGMWLLVAALAALVLATGAFAHHYLRRMEAAQRSIGQAKAALDQALASMVSGFVLLDAQQRVVQWNPRYVQLFPWLAPLLKVGEPFGELLRYSVDMLLPQGSEAERESWLARRLHGLLQPDGGSFELYLSSGMCLQITEQPTPDGGRVLTYHDVTDMRRASAEIEKLAFYAPLTGLPNRRLLLDRLQQLCYRVQRSGQSGALLFLDLDHFKVLNDSCGHEVGDILLQQVATRLHELVRMGDTVARLGGDEFVVLIGELSAEPLQAALQVEHIGEKILWRLGQPYALPGQSYQGACSIGITLFSDGRHSAAELLKRADIAMYQAKAQRGHSLCFFNEKMQELITQRARLEADMQFALVREQFELHYQPQFNRAGQMVGAEALLRWRHPQRGMVSPAEFIPLAEEGGMIVPLGLWVLRTACQHLAAWQQQPTLAGAQLSVNVSARQFRQADFAQQVTEVLQGSGAPAHLLKLELTESMMLEDVQDTIEKMHTIRTKGVRFAMDDFGTGHSSLAYLTRLPLDQLKIDQSFVRNLGVRHSDDVIVQTIIGMARTLELEVIAEGVETCEQRDTLAAYGCEQYQGYLYSRPVPQEQLVTLLQAHNAALSAQL